MLGDLIAEGQGKVTGTRVLPSEGGAAKVEVSFQGTGKLLGTEYTEMGTYWSVLNPGGFLSGAGQGVIMTKDGQNLMWTGQGFGRFTGKGGGVRWRGAIFYTTASEKLARLNGAVGVFEYETDENNQTTAKVWEWR